MAPLNVHCAARTDCMSRRSWKRMSQGSALLMMCDKPLEPFARRSNSHSPSQSLSPSTYNRSTSFRSVRSVMCPKRARSWKAKKCGQNSWHPTTRDRTGDLEIILKINGNNYSLSRFHLCHSRSIGRNVDTIIYDQRCTLSDRHLT